ncbi:MAG TPA: hypothetical protein VF454_07385 [Gemmatimonadales bacterium]
MSHLPAIPEVILLDFLPEPGELQGLIRQHLPGLATPTVAARSRLDQGRPEPKPRVEGFILLDFLPSLVALDGVIKQTRRPPAVAAQGGGY